jgi:hypothetical protein
MSSGRNATVQRLPVRRFNSASNLSFENILRMLGAVSVGRSVGV